MYSMSSEEYVDKNGVGGGGEEDLDEFFDTKVCMITNWHMPQLLHHLN